MASFVKHLGVEPSFSRFQSGQITVFLVPEAGVRLPRAPYDSFCVAGASLPTVNDHFRVGTLGVEPSLSPIRTEQITVFLDSDDPQIALPLRLTRPCEIVPGFEPGTIIRGLAERVLDLSPASPSLLQPYFWLARPVSWPGNISESPCFACAQEGSNPHQRLRRPQSYPLNDRRIWLFVLACEPGCQPSRT